MVKILAMRVDGDGGGEGLFCSDQPSVLLLHYIRAGYIMIVHTFLIRQLPTFGSPKSTQLYRWDLDSDRFPAMEVYSPNYILIESYSPSNSRRK